jgi:hypothetical protein
VAPAADVRAAVAALRGEIVAGVEVLEREVPFVLGLPAGAPRLFLHGRLDLLVRRDDVDVVRDYKYAAADPAAVANHGPQLAAYQLAVLGGGAERVAAELVFLRGGPVVRPVPPLDREAEEAALVEAGDRLARALAVGTADAFPRRPPDPAACAALGCGHVRRCWSAAVTRTASGPPSDSAAS